MNINLGFDAKRAYRNATGLGNYSRVLLAGLADSLTKLKQESYSLHLFGPNPKPDLLKSFNRTAFKHHHPSGLLNRTFPSIWRSKGILDDFRRHQIRLYHGLSAELPWGIHSAGVKSVVTVHDLIFLRYPENYSAIDRNMYTYKLKRAVKEADHVVATSRFTANDLKELLHVPEERISVHYQDCQPWFKDNLHSIEDDQASLLNLGLNRPFLLVVGTIEKRKNGLRLSKAFIKALENEEVDLVFAGKPTSFTQFIRNLKLSKSAKAGIKILDNLPWGALPTLYRNCLFHVYISEYEGFGIPILEALNAGKTSLTSSVGCFSEVGGSAVAYADAFSIDGIASGLHQLYFNHAYRSGLEALTKSQAAQFSTDKLVNQTWELYRRLLSE